MQSTRRSTPSPTGRWQRRLRLPPGGALTSALFSRRAPTAGAPGRGGTRTSRARGKPCVIDNETAIAGSASPTHSGLRRSRGAMPAIRSSALAGQLAATALNCCRGAHPRCGLSRCRESCTWRWRSDCALARQTSAAARSTGAGRPGCRRHSPRGRGGAGSPGGETQAARRSNPRPFSPPPLWPLPATRERGLQPPECGRGLKGARLGGLPVLPAPSPCGSHNSSRAVGRRRQRSRRRGGGSPRISASSLMHSLCLPSSV
jgi:hypothetical protein